MKNLGEFTPGKTIRTRFNTHEAGGAPITLAGTPAVSVYKGSTTESTAGVTLTVDYDGRTGLHEVVVDTSADSTFYAAGSDFDIVITTGTVDSISVVGTVIGTFSLANRAGLRPTTADRTLGVDASGRVDLGFWLGAAPDALSAGKLPADLKLWLATAPLALSSQRVQALAAAIATDAIDAAAVKADAVTKIQNGLATAAGVSALHNLSAGEVETAAGAALEIYDGPTNAEMEARTLPSAQYALETTLTAIKGGSWSTETLVALKAEIDAKLDTADYTAPPSLASLALEATAQAIHTKTTNLPAAPAAVGSAMTLTSGERQAIAAALLDLADAIEDGITVRQAQRAILAAAAGLTSGAGTAEFTLQNPAGDVDRIVATIAANNRTAITLDLD
jgi:hypothetical protein